MVNSINIGGMIYIKMSTNGAICKRLAKTTGKATTDVTSYMSTIKEKGKKIRLRQQYAR